MGGSRIQGRDVSLSTAIEIVQTERYVSELRQAIDSAVPNAGHDALATLEQCDLIEAVIVQDTDGCTMMLAARILWSCMGVDTRLAA